MCDSDAVAALPDGAEGLVPGLGLDLPGHEGCVGGALGDLGGGGAQ